MHEVVNRLVAIVGCDTRPEFGGVPDRPGEEPRVANTLTAAKRLSWYATTSLDSGLQQTVDWYKSVVDFASIGGRSSQLDCLMPTTP